MLRGKRIAEHGSAEQDPSDKICFASFELKDQIQINEGTTEIFMDFDLITLHVRLESAGIY
jgi:hypothetical protein